jgi:hypothetical protein
VPLCGTRVWCGCGARKRSLFLRAFFSKNTLQSLQSLQSACAAGTFRILHPAKRLAGTLQVCKSALVPGRFVILGRLVVRARRPIAFKSRNLGKSHSELFKSTKIVAGRLLAHDGLGTIG